MYNPPPPYPQTPNEGPDSRTEKINSIWKIISLIYTMGALGLVLYWEFKDTGLCMIVREWQGKLIDDGYYPAVDILLTLIILVIPLFIAKVIVEKVTGVKIKTNYKTR
jgi:hypothetical protein